MVGLSKDHQQNHNHNHNQNNHNNHQNQNKNMVGGRPPPPPLSGLSMGIAPPPGMQLGGGGSNGGSSSPQGGIDQLSVAAAAAIGGGGFPPSPSSLSPSQSPSPSPLMTMMMFAAAAAAAQGGSGLPLPPPPPPSLSALSASSSDMDRDSLIGWLRGEFAAANAIIDTLCLHLRTIGTANEYDATLASIFHRCRNWPLVLNLPHPQPYFPITEIAQALHQVASNKKKLPKSPQSVQDQTPANRPQTAYPPGFSISSATTNNNNTASSPNKPQQQQQQQTPIAWPRYGSPQKQLEDFMHHASSDPLMLADLHQPKQRTEVDPGNGHCTPSPISKVKDLGRDGDSNLVCKFPLREQQTIGLDMIKAAENMSSARLIERKMPNIAETLELRENIFNSHETAHLVHAIDEIALGRLEMINDEILDPIPIFLQMAVDRLIRLQILSAHKRPDCCIINIINKGASMLHCAKIHEAEQPLCIVSLQSDCVIFFGNGNSKENHLGDFENSHKVSLPVGSVLLLQGKSASMERCVPASPTKRTVIVTFAKASRRQENFWGVQPSSEEVLMLSRGASMNAAGGLQYESSLKPAPPPSLSGILPMPSAMLSLQLPMAGLQPMFPSPVGVGGQGSPYSPVMTQGWPPMPRPLLPPSPSAGTGVFFPSSSPPNGSGKPHAGGNPLRAHSSYRIEPLTSHAESFSQISVSPPNKDILHTDTTQIPVDIATTDPSDENATQR